MLPLFSRNFELRLINLSWRFWNVNNGQIEYVNWNYVKLQNTGNTLQAQAKVFQNASYDIVRWQHQVHLKVIAHILITSQMMTAAGMFFFSISFVKQLIHYMLDDAK